MSVRLVSSDRLVAAILTAVYNEVADEAQLAARQAEADSATAINPPPGRRRDNWNHRLARLKGEHWRILESMFRERARRAAVILDAPGICAPSAQSGEQTQETPAESVQLAVMPRLGKA